MADAGTARAVALTVRGRDDQRCADALGRQIDRLFGVRRVSPDTFSVQAA